MKSSVASSVLTAFVFAFLLSLLLLGTVGMAAAYADEMGRVGVEPSGWAAPAQPVAEFSIVLPILLAVPVFGLTGEPTGEATHMGEVRCRTKCSKSIELAFESGTEIRYRFTTRQVSDPIARRVVVSGEGRANGQGMPDRFLFTATFEDNGDGTISTRYEASMPEASFVIPRTPGVMHIGGS